MAVLPEEVPTGLLTGQMYFVNEDTIGDADANPQLLVVTGKVKIKASVPIIRMSGKKAVLVPLTFDAKFDNSGYLIPDGGDGQGIRLPATNSNAFDTKGWTYTATFELVAVETGYTVNVAPVVFQVPENGEVDLSEIIPSPPTAGVVSLRGPAGAVANVTAVTIAAGSEPTATLTGDDLELGIPAAVADDEAVSTLFGTPGTQTETSLKAAIDNTIRGEMFMGAATALSMGVQSFGVSAHGDSTTTPDNGWFRLLANDMAARFPAFTHHYRKWNDTKKDFDRPVVLATGPNGRRSVVMPSTGSRNGRQITADPITGDLDVRMNLSHPSWIGGGTQVWAARWTSDTDASWAAYLNNDGSLRIQWSSNGTTTWAGDKSSGAPVPFANGAEGWIRAVIDVDNGAGGYDVKFYTGTDGETWTQLGTTQTGAGVTAVHAGASRYVIGCRSTSSTPLAIGARIFEVQMRDGINGPSVVPYLPDLWAKSIGALEMVAEGSPVVTWVLGAHPGAGIGYDYLNTGYLTTWARHMAPNFGQEVMFFNSSHNEYDLTGNAWHEKYSAWVDTASKDKKVASRVMLTQNPRTLPDADNIGHKQRRAAMLALAKRGAGLDIIDTYQAFLDDGRALVGALISDGVHPTAAGYQLWYERVVAEFNAALTRTS